MEKSTERIKFTRWPPHSSFNLLHTHSCMVCAADWDCVRFCKWLRGHFLVCVFPLAFRSRNNVFSISYTWVWNALVWASLSLGGCCFTSSLFDFIIYWRNYSVSNTHPNMDSFPEMSFIFLHLRNWVWTLFSGTCYFSFSSIRVGLWIGGTFSLLSIIDPKWSVSCYWWSILSPLEVIIFAYVTSLKHKAELLFQVF